MRPPSLYESWISLPSLTTLLRTLPARQLFSLWAAIFSTFSMLGFSMDVMHEGRQPIALLALGMFDGTTFGSQTIDAPPGDLFALLTDGIVEVFDGETRELGLDWAKHVLATDYDRRRSSPGSPERVTLRPFRPPCRGPQHQSGSGTPRC